MRSLVTTTAQRRRVKGWGHRWSTLTAWVARWSSACWSWVAGDGQTMEVVKEKRKEEEERSDVVGELGSQYVAERERVQKFERKALIGRLKREREKRKKKEKKNGKR